MVVIKFGKKWQVLYAIPKYVNYIASTAFPCVIWKQCWDLATASVRTNPLLKYNETGEPVINASS